MPKRKKRNAGKEVTPADEVPSAGPVNTPLPTEPDFVAGQESRFPIVGIGASAGGLAAFEAFFSAIPGETSPGMAFVLVQHLAPDHKSILSDLVKRYTRMKVYEVEDGMRVAANCAYIIPPKRDMAILNGVLQLLDPAAPHGHRLPIDYFFRSLAQDQRERAICVVLSGTGSDGTLGVRAIKGEGGMAMAQSPESTEYDGMPSNAIATGLVDYVLPPAEMPSQLMAYAAHAFGKHPALPSPLPAAKPEDVLKKILILLRTQTGHDFSQYKHNTINRRIERRMAVHQIERLDEYVRFMQQNPAEVEALFRDLLIGVTGFFRDPGVWEALKERIIPGLFADKTLGEPVRIWVPGCSTGEEAYSIAMLAQEQIEALKLSFKVQLFATDIDHQAVEQARTGLYPASIAGDVTPERLARFFIQESDGSSYRINRAIRDMLVFSEQDVIKDPPFSKLDLISCRNLLIYLGGELQKRLIALFHYALNPNGALFLGTSETVGDFESLFAVIDRKSRLYRRKEPSHLPYRPPAGRFLPAMTDGGAAPASVGKTPGEGKLPVREMTERELLQQYAPVGVLVNERGDILYIHGRTGQYLEPAAGEASSMNILKMAREGVRRDLTTMLHKVATLKEPLRQGGLKVKTNGSFSKVNLAVRPVPGGSNLFLVLFEEVSTPDIESSETAVVENSAEVAECSNAGDGECIAALKRELRAKEEYLQAANEELETSNEELKSSNEEMQSVNEELQSTNEELETSKEELQSVNEELATVNAELQQKVADLSRANNDMNNLLAGTGVGTVFVDLELNITRFTPAATQLINLIQTDVGRPVGHLVSNLLVYDRLVEDVQAVLDNLVPKEIEVKSKADAWYSMRIRPYRTLDNVIEGAVITFLEITEQKRVQESLRESETLRRLAAIVRDSNDAVTMQDFEGRILAWNPGAERMYGWSEAEALSMNIRDMVPEDSRDDEPSLMRRLSKGEKLEPFRSQRLAKDGKVLDVWLTISALVNPSGLPYAVSTIERQIQNRRSSDKGDSGLL